MYGWHDSPIVGVQNDPVTFDILCKEIHREVFEVFTLFKQKLEMISHKVDAFLEQVLQS